MDRIFEQLRMLQRAADDWNLGSGRAGGQLRSHGPHEQRRAIYIGPEEPANSKFFDEVVLGKAGEVLPGLVKDADYERAG